nr:MAG TPA: hypothetical protein [Bacteriophage sp.]
MVKRLLSAGDRSRSLHICRVLTESAQILFEP